MYQLWISLFVAVTSYIAIVIEGRVDIVSQQPFYVEYGSNLSLTCVSDSGRVLEWLQEVRDPQSLSGWRQDVIEPVIGGSYITRYTLEKPSLYVENTLVKHGMAMEDRGMYECRDQAQENSFVIWVNVLYISKDDVKVTEASSDVYLYCSIQGFDSNIPYIDYYWYYEEQTIMTNHKYDIVYRDGVLQLAINNPGVEDGGDYTCSFTLQTNKEPVIFTKDVNLDTSGLETSGVSSVMDHVPLVTALLLFISVSLSAHFY